MKLQENLNNVKRNTSLAYMAFQTENLTNTFFKILSNFMTNF